VRKLAPERRSDLRYFLGRTAKPVESRHQRGMQGRWDRDRRRWNGSSRPIGRAWALRFHHCLGHFLHKKRNAIGALDDVLTNVRCQ
jgi:hypothetical protein